ncbi:MAG: sigma 54-interacting transcriptional regulator, partial [Desulfomicrobium sp.]|nr:sigma 54-interacting transcriptional regulator [Desulfomicrobium sp.]
GIRKANGSLVGARGRTIILKSVRNNKHVSRWSEFGEHRWSNFGCHYYCSIIAATNRNLEEQVKSKAFREDLYYRLNALALEIPPLRSRPEDVLELSEKFLAMYNDQYQTEKRISPKGMELLLGHSYPGNARELRNLIKQAVVMSDDGIIDEALSIAMSGETQNDDLNLTLAIEKVERELLVRARKIYRNTREIARHLGISQPSVVRKMGKHKIR